METKEYKSKLLEITKKFKDERRKIAKDYAFSNNTINKGDTIRTKDTEFIVDNISFIVPYEMDSKELPYCLYQEGMCKKSKWATQLEVVAYKPKGKTEFIDYVRNGKTRTKTQKT